MSKFTPGTVVVFDPHTLNSKFWDNLSEEDRIKFYGPLGYGGKEMVRFVFMCEIINAPGHCVLISLEDQSIQTMRHTENFREVTEDEI